MNNQFIVYTTLLVFLNSCSPILQSHGYKMEKSTSISEILSDIESSSTTNKNDIINLYGNPSIKISDIDQTWIYLISEKKKNVFKKDEIDFQFILSFKFDDQDNLIKKDLIDQESINKVSFSKDKTKIPSSSYNLADQIIQSFTRGQ